MSKARGLADLGNVYDDGALSNRSLIINGNFQVSQRGDFTTASSVSNQSYYLDRWVMSVGISGTLQDTGYKAKVVCTSTGSGVLAMSQNIEDKNIHPFKGKTVTVSCKMTSNSPNARIVIYADNWLSLGNQNDVHSGGGSEETLSATFTVPSDLSGYLQVRVGFENAESNGNPSLSANDYFEVSEVQLELGDTVTPFEHRSYSDEIQRCMRYYYEITFTGQYQTVFLPCAVINSNTLQYQFKLPTIMRAGPSTTHNGVGNFRLNDWVGGGIHDEVCNAITISEQYPESVRYSFSKATNNLTSNQVGYVNTQENNDAKLTFDAEL